jgi:hypothetical protein
LREKEIEEANKVNEHRRGEGRDKGDGKGINKTNQETNKQTKKLLLSRMGLGGKKLAAGAYQCLILPSLSIRSGDVSHFPSPSMEGPGPLVIGGAGRGLVSL